MPKERSDHLFTLIKSLRKSEKRYFKIRNKGTGRDSSKYLLLFDAIDHQDHFDEEEIVLKNKKWISRAQLSNLKAHLYKKILQSLKEYTSSANEEILIREQIDYIQLLYDRSLYDQSTLLLQKVKKALNKSRNLELQLEVLKWEKILLPHSLGKNNLDRVQQIVKEANQVTEHISRINLLTNLSAELSAIYLKTGYVRDKSDYEMIQSTFTGRLPDWPITDLSFREELLWNEMHLAYYIFVQSYEQAYIYASKWAGLFPEPPGTSHYFEMYLKGLNQLLNVQSRLYLIDEFAQTHRRLRNLANHRLVQLNENLQIRLFKYSYAHQFNGYFLLGDFNRGVKLLHRIETRLESYIGMLDKHSELVLFYKIACLYFGNGNYRQALKWLNRIINSEDQDIREDVHSFARILNLIVHYELGNQDVIEYYLRSTYRFLLKKDDLHKFQQFILDFLKRLTRHMTTHELTERFKILKSQLEELEKSKYDRRAFVYFDIISWLESKIENVPVARLIQEKAKAKYQIALRSSQKPASRNI